MINIFRMILVFLMVTSIGPSKRKPFFYDIPPVPLVLSATYYNAVEAQCNEEPHITACGFKVNMKNPSANRFVALSRDLIKPTEWHSVKSGYRHDAPFSFGDTILVRNSDHFDGFWIVADSMNERYNQQNRIDFLVSESYIAFDSGKSVEVYGI